MMQYKGVAQHSFIHPVQKLVEKLCWVYDLELTDFNTAGIIFQETHFTVEGDEESIDSFISHLESLRKQ